MSYCNGGSSALSIIPAPLCLLDSCAGMGQWAHAAYFILSNQVNAGSLPTFTCISVNERAFVFACLKGKVENSRNGLGRRHSFPVLRDQDVHHGQKLLKAEALERSKFCLFLLSNIMVLRGPASPLLY